MATAMTGLRQRDAWKELERHFESLQGAHLRDLFADDAGRGERLTVEAAGLYLDYSKNRITDETVELLVRLADECGLRERIEAMFTGEKINVTENRAVLHVALRAPKDEVIEVDGENVVPGVHEVLDRMSAFADRVRSGEWRGRDRQAHHGRDQHRHRRLRPRPRHGLRGAAALLAARPRPSASSRTSTARTSSRRPATSTRRRRSSSSRRRRSRRSRR